MADCTFIAPAQDTSSIFVNCTNVVTTALVVYEHGITFSQEVEVIWKRKRTLPGALFLLNRCNILINAIMVVLTCIFFQTNASTTIPTMTILLDVSSVLAFFLTAAFTALRVYALWARDNRLFFVIFTLSLAPAIISLICLALLLHAGDIVVPEFVGLSPGCKLRRSIDPELQKRLVLASQLPSVVSDALVVILTWIKTLDQFRTTRRMHMKTSLNNLILRDGTVYFLVLLAVHVLQIIAFRSFCLTHISYVLSSILVSRFLLNLRQADQQPTTKSTSRWLSNICFADIQGNLAEPLVLAGDVREDESDAMILCSADKGEQHPHSMRSRQDHGQAV